MQLAPLGIIPEDVKLFLADPGRSKKPKEESLRLDIAEMEPGPKREMNLISVISCTRKPILITA